MISTLAAVEIAVGLLLLVLLRRVAFRKSLKHIRGPPSPSLLFGHEYIMSHRSDVGSLEFSWMREYGPTWRIKGYFGTDMLMTADPKIMQHIYQKSAYKYLKRASQNHMSYLGAGPGIVSASGAEDHRRHRKIMNPSFSAVHLRSFLPIFQRIGGKLTEKWKKDVAANNGMEILVNKWISRTTLDIIGQTAFDFDYGGLSDGEGGALSKAYDNFFVVTEYGASKASELFRATWNYLPEAILKLFRFIPAQPFTHFRYVRSLYTQYGKQILREKQMDGDAEKQRGSRDIMSVLINANSSADPKARLNDEEVMAQMFTLTVAGHETTASTLTFLLYELARHPEYQTRLRAEICETRARVAERGSSEFTIEDLDSMTLVMNAIKETLRFHSIVSHLPRVAFEDDVLPLSHPVISATGETITEIPISAGQVIVASFAGYHRLTDVWGHDADIWNPDRFTRPEVGKHTNVGMFANLMAFSAGSRGCIGWRFSVIEMQALLAELVENFEYALPKNEVTIARTAAGTIMVPMIRGKEDLGAVMPLRVSLVQ